MIDMMVHEGLIRFQLTTHLHVKQPFRVLGAEARLLTTRGCSMVEALNEMQEDKGSC